MLRCVLPSQKGIITAVNAALVVQSAARQLSCLEFDSNAACQSRVAEFMRGRNALGVMLKCPQAASASPAGQAGFAHLADDLVRHAKLVSTTYGEEDKVVPELEEVGDGVLYAAPRDESTTNGTPTGGEVISGADDSVATPYPSSYGAPVDPNTERMDPGDGDDAAAAGAGGAA